MCRGTHSSPARHRRHAEGFTLLETAVVIVISGLLMQAMLTGAALIKNARVRGIIAQQDGAEAAFVAFMDRFRALPGDYRHASTNIDCGLLSCLDGNGNGRIEAGVDGALREDTLAWHHLSAGGFVEGKFQYSGTAPSYENTPANAFGGLLQIVSDDAYGVGAQVSVRINIKTGNRIPADVLAEVDRKVDDGLPGSGRFQFSPYVAAGAAAGDSSRCTWTDVQGVRWNMASGTDECGAATLLQ